MSGGEDDETRDDDVALAKTAVVNDVTQDDVRPVEARSASSAPMRALVLGRYEVERLLGEGGMGEVHACRDVILERSVALKAIRRDRQARHLEARFVREACVQGQLEHPSVVPVFEVGRDEVGSAYFTMRKVSGITLDEILEGKRSGDPRMITKKSETFSRHRLLAAFTQICLTVHYAHARGVLHRDIKPSNIMFGDFGEVYVLDWGLAKLAEPAFDTGRLPKSESVLAAASGSSRNIRHQTAVGTALGTPAYMAPEQVDAREVDARADVFALGAVLFEILTLEPMLDNAAVEARLRAQRATWDARPSVRAPDQGVPPEFDRICVRATAEDLDKRYASARALHDVVEAYLDGERDVELRKNLASSLFTQAEKTRATDPDGALREVNRALALAPDDRRGLELLVDLLKASSAASTAKAREEVAVAGVERQRRGQMLGIILYSLMWLTVYPFMCLFRGVTNVWVALIPPAVWALAVGGLLIDYIQRSHARVVYPTVLVMLAIGASAILFGPLITIPGVTVVAVAAHVFVCAPPLRRVTILSACGSIVLAMLPTWLGISTVYGFEGETILTMRGIMKTVRPFNLTVVLTGIDLFSLVGVSLFTYRFREDIERARTANSLFVWQLEKLLPPQVSEGSSTPEEVEAEASTAPLPPLRKQHSVERLLDTEIDAKPLREIDRTTFTRAAGEGEEHSPDDTEDAFPLLALDGSRYVDAEVLVQRETFEVQRVRDRLVGRDVAMKRRRALAEDPSSLGALPETPHSFMQQALLQARVDHPAVPSIYDVGHDETGPWFTMKLVRGEPLSEVIRVEGASAQGRHQRLTAFAKVCLAIDYAHDHGIIHGGLATSSIVLGEFGEVHVLGWGQARLKTADEDAGVADDIAALGEILFEIAAGKPVSSGERIPVILDEICAKAMAKKPESRYRTARRLHDAIEAFLSSDRDEGLRSSLAAERVLRAEKNVARAVKGEEPARVDALRDIGRALALAPDRTPALRLLQKLLDSPPAILPAVVKKELSDQVWELSRRTAPIAARLYLLLFVVAFPIYSLIVGIRDVGKFATIVVSWLVAAVVVYGQHRLPKRFTPLHFPVGAVASLVAVMSTSLLFGPYLMMFGLAVTITMVYVLAVQPEWRRFVIVLGAATLVIPAVASWTHVVDVFEAPNGFVATEVARFVIRGADYHPPWVFLVALVIVHILNVVLAGYYAANYRDRLDSLEIGNRARLLGLARLM